MLDPLNALGLASNIAQLISVASSIVSTGNKLYKSADGALVRYEDCKTATVDLTQLLANVRSKQNQWLSDPSNTGLSDEEVQLRNISMSCEKIGVELIRQLDKLKVRPESRNKRWASYRKALESVWRKESIDEILNRLDHYQRELDTRVLFGLQQTLERADVRGTEQFKVLDQRTKDLTNAVLDNGGTVTSTLHNHTTLLERIAVAQDETRQLLQLNFRSERRSSASITPVDSLQSSTVTDLPTALHEAAASGDEVRVRQLLRMPTTSINARDSIGRTPLHRASSPEVTRRLLNDKRIEVDIEDDEGRTALHHAVLKRNLAVLKELLGPADKFSGVSLPDKDIKDDYNKPAVFYACSCPAALWMLRCGTDPEAAPSDAAGYTALSRMVSLGDMEGVAFFLAQGANPSRPDQKTIPPLMIAIEMKLDSIAHTLISAGAAKGLRLAGLRSNWERIVPVVTESTESETTYSAANPLILSCQRGSFGIARMLIEDGFDINTRDTEGATPLWRATSAGSNAFIRWAIEQGADVNIQGPQAISPLLVAASRGDLEILTLLLKNGTNLEACSSLGWRPLSRAACLGHAQCVAYLLAEGADVNAPVSQPDHTAISSACSHGRTDIVRSLIAAGARTEATRHHQFDPIMAAAREGHDRCVRVLFESGVKLDSPSGSRSDSPFMCAARNGRVSTLETLASLGANIHARNERGETALHNAWAGTSNDSSTNQKECLSTLLRLGLSPRAATNIGSTPLHYFARVGNDYAVRLLIENGACPDVLDNDMDTPWMEAVDNGYGEKLQKLFVRSDEALPALNGMQTERDVRETAAEMLRRYDPDHFDHGSASRSE